MPEPQSAAASAPEGLLTRTFVVLVASATAYFTAMGMLLPVLPRYVTDELGGNGAQVGIAVGAFAVSAAAIRPLVGRLGDRLGRRPLAMVGAFVAGVSVLAYGVVPAFLALVVFRLVTGLGEAAYFVGAATAAQDLSPDGRRGEAASYFSIAIYGGTAFGPYLGETLYRSGGADQVWLVAALLSGFSAVAGLLIPASLGRRPEGSAAPAEGRRAFLHPAAALPGSILLLGTIGLAAITSFLALHLEDIGIADAGPYFLLYGVAVLAVRIVGARIPDRLGPIRASTAALVMMAASTVLLAAVSTPAVIAAAILLYAMGMALVYPALFGLVVEEAPDAERSHAIGTFTLYIDLAQGFGPAVLGVIITLTGTYRSAFAAGAVLAVAALVLARSRLTAPDGIVGDPEPVELTLSD